MGAINRLPRSVYEKIAAGEVVERPASVIKELVENSIDAGADKITVEIKNGGSIYMRVTDNGCGMEREDAETAFLRHATSKIASAEDLDSIRTMGFRGEALSSIGAVSEAELFTKRACDETGTHVVCADGEIRIVEDTGTTDGTVFVVRNLFYNVPARMKFLKKDATEAAYISNIMTRFILAHPEISFRFINNEKEQLFSAGDGLIKSAVYSVYGKNYARSAIEFDNEYNGVRVYGVAGGSDTARVNKDYQSCFVNKRYVKSPPVFRAIEEAYKNQVMIGKFPMAIVNIEINPSMIDINVHPTKMEVKFSDEAVVYRAVYHSVKNALYSTVNIPTVKHEDIKKAAAMPEENSDDERLTAENARKMWGISENPEESIRKKWNIAKAPAEKSRKKSEASEDSGETARKKWGITEEPEQFFLMEERVSTVKPKKPSEIENKGGYNTNYDEEYFSKRQAELCGSDIKKEPEHSGAAAIEDRAAAYAEESVKEERERQEHIEYEPTDRKRTAKAIGQVFDTYIIAESEGELLLIDQHAAHERLMYEKLKKDIASKMVVSQTMLVPTVVNMTSIEFAAYREYFRELSDMGFETEEFGDNAILVRAAPYDLDSGELEDLVIGLINGFSQNKNEVITEKQDRLLYTIACKAAIKANHALSIIEQQELCERVLNFDNINTCPHGRPITVSLPKKEIEKLFKRIV